MKIVVVVATENIWEIISMNVAELIVLIRNKYMSILVTRTIGIAPSDIGGERIF